MNKLLEIIVDRFKGNYCHALEVYNIYELEIIIEEIVREFKGRFGYTMPELKIFKEFFYSMDIYPLEGSENLTSFEDFEKELYSLNVGDLVTEIYKAV